MIPIWAWILPGIIGFISLVGIVWIVFTGKPPFYREKEGKP